MPSHSGCCGFPARSCETSFAVSTTGYAEPSEAWDIHQPFAWWALAHRQRDGSFVLRQGRVDYPGASRTLVQEEVAEAVIEARGLTIPPAEPVRP